MARWAYGYKSLGRRSLTEAELNSVRAARRSASTRATLLALAAVLGGGGALVSISLSAESPRIGWPLFALSVALFLGALRLTNRGGYATLLYGRTLRVGLVERFQLDEATPEVRDLYSQHWSEEEGGSAVRYWEQEEKFLRSLTRMARGLPQTFEALDLDGVVLFAGGRIARRVLNVQIVDNDDPTGPGRPLSPRKDHATEPRETGV